MSYHLPKHLLTPSLHEGSYSTQPQSEPQTIIQRLPATQLLTLNSADRTQTSAPGSSGGVSKQPWNKFLLQRPQNLMEAFATRISVAEIRFPWYIPNINSANNTIWMRAEADTPGNPYTLYTIAIPDGFYTLPQIITAINTEILLLNPPALNSPTFSLSGNQVVVSPGPGSGSRFNLYWFNPYNNTNTPSENQYLTNPSLASTLGFNYVQVSGEGSNTTQPLQGNITDGLYTQYVDIVSEKLNYYSHVKDGSSSNNTNRALICRLYLSDEASIAQQSPVGTTPFVIHRQFKTPKQVMWNKQAVIDAIDVSVIDQYGQLVPLPVVKNAQGGTPASTTGSYPDFQITLLASEN